MNNKLTPKQRFIIILGCVLAAWVICGMVLYVGMQTAVKIWGPGI